MNVMGTHLVYAIWDQDRPVKPAGCSCYGTQGLEGLAVTKNAGTLSGDYPTKNVPFILLATRGRRGRARGSRLNLEVIVLYLL